MSRLLERRRADLEKLIAALRELREERERLAADLDSLAEASHRGAVRQVNVRKLLNPGVLLEIGAVRHLVKQALAGPVTILEDRPRGALRIVEFRELPAAAHPTTTEESKPCP
jgi:hypothetical protein